MNGGGERIETAASGFFRGVKFHVRGKTGIVAQTVFNSRDIRYVDSDMRDGSTIVFFRDGGAAHVAEMVHEAANQWGQRENVVKYRRMDDRDLVLELVLRVDDVTGIEISTRDGFTVLVKSRHGVFPVVGKHEKIVEKAAYCRPFALFHKKADVPVDILSAVPVDLVSGVEASFHDGTTLVKTRKGILPVLGSVEEALAEIESAEGVFEARRPIPPRDPPANSK